MGRIREVLFDVHRARTGTANGITIWGSRRKSDSNAASAGRFCDVPGDCTDEVAAALADGFALGARK